MDRDRLEIDTPEGVRLALELAGIGSRGLAALIDLAIQAALIAFVAIIATSSDSAAADAVAVVAGFIFFFGYHIAFETLNAGQSIGKVALRLRVVRTDGGPISFVRSSIRSLLRIIDILPSFYLVGIVAVFSTERNQRLGDLSADSIVVQESAPVPRPPPPSAIAQARASVDVAARDASLVTSDELGVVELFLGRRYQIERVSTAHLADQLMWRLSTKVARPDEAMSAERFLEHVLAAKEGRAE